METCPTDRTNKKHNEHSKEAACGKRAASLFAGSTHPAQYRHLKPSYPTAAHSSAPFFRVGQNRRRPDNDTRPALRRLPKLEYSAGYGEHGMITKNSQQPDLARSDDAGSVETGKTYIQEKLHDSLPRAAEPNRSKKLPGKRSRQQSPDCPADGPPGKRVLAKDRIVPENGPKEPGNGSAGQIPAPYPAIGPASVPTEADTGL